MTLKATGGVRKTRLAFRAARELPPSHPDGFALVQLAAVSDESSVVFAALDAPADVEGSDSPVVAFTAALGERDALLVLDNCEQVIVAVAQLAAAVPERCSWIRLLYTSREPLNIG